MNEFIRLCDRHGVACFILPSDNYRKTCTVIFNKNGYCVNYHLTDEEFRELTCHFDVYLKYLLEKFSEEAYER